MVGHNIIGKIYKSKKTITLTNGYKLETKYKSNFGGTKDLKLVFRVNVNGVIEINTNNDLLINANKIDKSNIKTTTDEILINNKKFKEVNKVIKPDLYNAQKTVGAEILSKTFGNGLYVPLIVESNNKHNIIDIYLLPTIYENKEYIEMKIENVTDEKIIIKTAKETMI